MNSPHSRALIRQRNAEGGDRWAHAMRTHEYLWSIMERDGLEAVDRALDLMISAGQKRDAEMATFFDLSRPAMNSESVAFSLSLTRRLDDDPDLLWEALIARARGDLGAAFALCGKERLFMAVYGGDMNSSHLLDVFRISSDGPAGLSNVMRWACNPSWLATGLVQSMWSTLEFRGTCSAGQAHMRDEHAPFIQALDRPHLVALRDRLDPRKRGRYTPDLTWAREFTERRIALIERSQALSPGTTMLAP